jgi:hypothetical protein
MLAGFRHAAGRPPPERRHARSVGYNRSYAASRPNRHVEREGHSAELLELPAGRYVVQAVDGEAPVLSQEENAGIEAALESYRQRRVVDGERVRQIIEAAIGR